MERRALAGELLALLSDLVAIPSTYPPGDTTGIAAHCRDSLSLLGYTTTADRNLVARAGSGNPSGVFNAHADTVDVGDRDASRTHPFTARLLDGRVFGF